MRLLDTCLLSLSTAAFIIGVHQIMTIGFAQAYWIIMLSSILFLWYGIRKRKVEEAETESPKPADKQPRKLSKRKKKSKSTR